ncbi:MAG: GTP-binding protein, partial [Anaerolineae bacterium]
ARRILDIFRNYATTPYVVAANKQDMEDAWSPDDLRIALKVRPDVKLLPCVATEKESVKGVLIELLYTILDKMSG